MGGSGRISECEVASDAQSVVGPLNGNLKRGESRVRVIGGESGSGKAADEDRKEEKGSQMSKGDVDQFLLGKTRTSSSEDTGGLD